MNDHGAGAPPLREMSGTLRNTNGADHDERPSDKRQRRLVDLTDG